MLSGLPPPRGRDFQDRSGWSAWLLLAIPLLFAAGIAIRLAVLQSRGLVGDIDQFVLWVHGIAVNGWNRAYDQNLSFPAVMAWIWGGLAALEPAFRTVTDSSDPGIRSLMKVPATLADLGIAVAVVWWFRDRPKLAVLAAAAVLLWPAVWYVSSWWGQYESIYVLFAVLALLAARARLPLVAAALLAVSLMTKPQALPFLVPFAAWFLATQGWRGTLKAAIVGAVVVVLLWLPFVAAGGPANYLNNLATYQNDIFGVLSLNAWNPWALLQVIGANGEFVSDRSLAFGPITLPARRVRARRPVRPDRVRRRLPAARARPAGARHRGHRRSRRSSRSRRCTSGTRTRRSCSCSSRWADPPSRRSGSCSRSPSCSTCWSRSRRRAGRSPMRRPSPSSGRSS